MCIKSAPLASAFAKALLASAREVLTALMSAASNPRFPRLAQQRLFGALGR